MSGVLRTMACGMDMAPRVLNPAPGIYGTPLPGVGGGTKQPQMTSCHFIRVLAPWLKSLRTPALRNINSEIH